MTSESAQEAGEESKVPPAFDVGAESGRGVLGRFDGGRLQLPRK
jgi:hypothetical protein